MTECNCPGGTKPAHLHAPNCPTRAVLAPVDVAAVLADLRNVAELYGVDMTHTIAAVERMAAENRLLDARECAAKQDRDHWKRQHDAKCDEAVALRQRLEAAEAYAARYRWLRRGDGAFYIADDHACGLIEEKADAAIDAAIALQEPRNVD